MNSELNIKPDAAEALEDAETRETTSSAGQPVAGGSDHETMRVLVAQQPFFAGMTPHQIDLLADSALQLQFEPGEWIFAEGDLANRFFLILDGQVVLEAEAEDHSQVPIQILGPGDDLGWSWMFPPWHFRFGARSLAPTKVICFYGTRLRRQCEEDHELGYELMTRVARVTVSRLEATRRQLLKLKSHEPSVI